MNDSRVALSLPMTGVPQTFVPPPPSTLLDGFIGGWDLNGNGFDVLGISPATPINSPVFVTGKDGQQALRTFGLDPTGEGYFQVNTFPSSRLRPTNSLTASMWLQFIGSYPASSTRIFSDYNQNPSSTRWILGFNLSGTLCAIIFIAGGVGDIIVPIELLTNMGLGTWNHIAVSWDGTTIKSYLNGVAKTTVGRIGSMPTGGSTPLSIGTQFNAGQGNRGSQQNCYMWNRALTPSEHIELYNSGVVNRYPFTGSP